MVFDTFSTVYERGVAVGFSDVHTDEMVFQYKSETFSLPARQAHQIARWNGYFYEAPIDEVRKLEAELAKGP